jgi:putative ABC transport system substrate-binding protein
MDQAQAASATALNVLASRTLDANRKIILGRNVALRLPAIYQWPERAEEGGLAAYGPRYANVLRQLARQVLKELRGLKAPDLPVEQPTTFDVKTAKALGLTIPAIGPRLRR